MYLVEIDKAGLELDSFGVSFSGILVDCLKPASSQISRRFLHQVRIRLAKSAIRRTWRA